MNVIAVDRVTKRFAGHVAVEDLSLTVPQGGIFGLLGPNGAGKSTTIRMILDILIPDEGKISLFGDARGARDLSARIGFLPEERGLYPRMLVLDSLIFLGQMRGLSRANARHRALWWLEKVGLSDWSKRKVQDLSKGMQQKVQLVGALLHEPDLLVLDEPFSGLDPVGVDALAEVLRQRVADGVAVLFSSHQLELVERLCDRVAIIRAGSLVASGTVEELSNDPGGRRSVLVAVDAPAGWPERVVAAVAGAQLVRTVARPAGTAALVRLAPGVDEQPLLEAARAAGPVREMTPWRTSLAERFRSVMTVEASLAAAEGEAA
jgi:ABC-2 type transport system ATP-binding protein